MNQEERIKHQELPPKQADSFTSFSKSKLTHDASSSPPARPPEEAVSLQQRAPIETQTVSNYSRFPLKFGSQARKEEVYIISSSVRNPAPASNTSELIFPVKGKATASCFRNGVEDCSGSVGKEPEASVQPPSCAAASSVIPDSYTPVFIRSSF